ncbi:MAG: hypothetical protein U0401_06090 [Anaerolineae bacterium]
MKQLSANPGDLEQALADLAQAEAKLRELQDPRPPPTNRRRANCCSTWLRGLAPS